jgi:hypothetical protein
MEKMTLKEFNPNGATGDADSDMLYHWWVTGPQGARFQLLKEKHHTEEDVKKAQRWLRVNLDVVSIAVVTLIEENVRARVSRSRV